MSISLTKVLGFGAILYFAFSSFAKKVSLKSIKARGVSIDFSALTFKLDLGFENLSSVILTADSFVGGIYLAGVQVSDVILNESVIVPSEQVATVVFDVSIPIVDLASDVIAIVNNGNFMNLLRLKGRLVVNGISTDIDQPIITIGG